jgi:hypothetical protein
MTCASVQLANSCKQKRKQEVNAVPFWFCFVYQALTTIENKIIGHDFERVQKNHEKGTCKSINWVRFAFLYNQVAHERRQSLINISYL